LIPASRIELANAVNAVLTGQLANAKFAFDMLRCDNVYFDVRREHMADVVQQLHSGGRRTGQRQRPSLFAADLESLGIRHEREEWLSMPHSAAVMREHVSAALSGDADAAFFVAARMDPSKGFT
jgi:hypothetical protein